MVADPLRAIAAGLGLGAAVGLWAAGVTAAEPGDRTASAAGEARPVYVPPARGAPGGRQGGGARTAGDLVLLPLAPDHTGLTGREQPVIYWFASKPTAAPVEFTLMDEGSKDPRLDVRLGPADGPGIRGLRLADYDIRLEPGVTYEWTVAVVVDEQRRSHDVLAGGTIEHVAPPGDLAREVAAAGDTGAALAYARAGYWYDAIATLSAGIDADPARAADLRAGRAAVLDQVALPEIAAFDRGAADSGR